MKNCIRIVLVMMLCMLAQQWSVASNIHTSSLYEQAYEEDHSSLLSELHSIDQPDSEAYKHLCMQSFCIETCLAHPYNIKFAIKLLNRVVDRLFYQHQTTHSVIHLSVFTLIHPVDYYIFGLKRILI